MFALPLAFTRTLAKYTNMNNNFQTERLIGPRVSELDIMYVNNNQQNVPLFLLQCFSVTRSCMKNEIGYKTLEWYKKIQEESVLLKENNIGFPYD